MSASNTALRLPDRPSSAVPADLAAQAHEAAKLLKALANPDRLLLLCHLVEVERSVGVLGELTGIAQPSLSQQLGVLRVEGLVATRRQGKSIFYRIAAPAVHAVLQALYTTFCENENISLRKGARA